MDANEYARMLRGLLPSGPAWVIEPGDLREKVLLAIADELVRIDGRAVQLQAERDPTTALETLDDWERTLGLPDSCIVQIPATTAARRVAITQKLVQVGGQSKAYFLFLAAACGYTVTIDDSYGLTVLRSGFLCGSRCWGEQWAHVWRLDVQPPAGTALTHAEFECIISRVKPSHTIVLFTYF